MTEHPSPSTFLPRVRSFEFHDLPWIPYPINFMTTRLLEMGWTTDYTTLIPIAKCYYLLCGRRKLYEEEILKRSSIRYSDGLADLLKECHEKVRLEIRKTKTKTDPEGKKNILRILDLCSGAGGPSFQAIEKLFEDNCLSTCFDKLHLTVSDLFPHPQHWKSRVVKNSDKLEIDFAEKSVDATKVDPSLARGAIWTINAAFHHFDDDLALKILKSAVENEECHGLLIVELSEHRITACLMILPVIFVLGILIPFYIMESPAKILESRKNFFLYLQVLFFMPVFLFTMMWDSVVSCLRTLTTQELLELAKKADPENKMEWHSAVRDFVPGFDLAPGIVYLRGVKKR